MRAGARRGWISLLAAGCLCFNPVTAAGSDCVGRIIVASGPLASSYLAQLPPADPRYRDLPRPYLSVQDSIDREIERLPYDEAIKYAAYLILFVQPMSPATSALVLPALKVEVAKDVLFAVARGIAKSDYVRDRAGVKGQRELDITLATFEASMDFAMFLDGVTNAASLQPGEVQNFLGGLPSSMLDVIAGVESGYVQMDSVRFLISFAEERADECDFEYAASVADRAGTLLPRLRARLVPLETEVRRTYGHITGQSLGPVPNNLPLNWRLLPGARSRPSMDGRPSQNPFGDDYQSAVAEHRNVVNAIDAISRLHRKVVDAEKKYREDRARVERLLTQANSSLWACEADRGYAALLEISSMVGTPGVRVTTPFARSVESQGCWGWVLQPFREIEANYARFDRQINDARVASEEAYGRGAAALADCRLREVVSQLEGLERIGRAAPRAECVKHKYIDLRREFEAVRQSGHCDNVPATVKGSARPTSSGCNVPKDIVRARKAAIHAKIGKYAPERKRGGDQWHPDYTFRAGRLVGSVDMPATGPQLNAMEALVDGYHACYQPFWQFIEGVLPAMQRDADLAYKQRDAVAGNYITQQLRDARGKVTRDLQDCIKREDDRFNAAMASAKELCK